MSKHGQKFISDTRTDLANAKSVAILKMFAFAGASRRSIMKGTKSSLSNSSKISKHSIDLIIGTLKTKAHIDSTSKTYLCVW